MIVRTVRKNNNNQSEFVFGHGYTDYKSELAFVKQDVETALYEWKNDCFFDIEAGIDWKVRLGYHNQKDLLDEDIKELVVSRTGVLRIVNFESNVIDRLYVCTIEILTLYSEETLSITTAQTT